MKANWIIGIDVGGTFTDLFAFDRTSGRLAVHKTSSTPENPANAILLGIGELAAKADIPLGQVRVVAHGTTVATNALIQRKGGTVAMITTKNFRDLLEIGRQIRPKLYDLKADHPQPLARREHRFEVTERIGADGEIVESLDDDSLSAAVAAVRESGAEACAICFLFAHLNGDHERRVGEALRTAIPGLWLSLSSEVQPEFREYERFSTTVLNAYLQPALVNYLRQLQHELGQLAPAARIGINQSSAGLMSIERAISFPIRTALSGPAAGATGAIHVARLADRGNVITLDMGGTSADVTLIRDFKTMLGFNRDIAGFPIRLPMVDIHTVGAGGGSISWFDKDGLLKVGPLSAGAVPGPACYGRGGEDATVTDANLVLGRLSARGLLGGSMGLDADAAASAVSTIAERVGFTVERTAQGILDIVTANMVRAIRTISVERGHDPRDFVLMPFGGAGPLHANGCAHALGIREIIVPFSPGILCAEGLLVADLSESWVRSQRLGLREESLSAMQNLIDGMLVDARTWWRDEDVPEDSRGLAVTLDMRYSSQNYELQVALPVDGADPRLPEVASLRRSFFAAHDQAYGFHNEEDPVDVVAVRLTATGRLPSPSAPTAPAGASCDARPREKRRVWFTGSEPHDTPVYDRDHLAPGARIEGPAVIDQFDATTLVFPGDVARVDGALSLRIEVGK